MVVEGDPGRRDEAERAVREARMSLARARGLMERTRTLLSAARSVARPIEALAPARR